MTIESQEAGKIIAEEKEEAEIILNQALPTLLDARDALNNLQKGDITEIRSFATPPEPVQVVSECVAILLGYKEVNWKVAKQMMSDPKFLSSLKNLNVDELTLKQQSQIRAKLKVPTNNSIIPVVFIIIFFFISTKQASTKMSLMKDISKAGFGLLSFVEAVLKYCVVYREVKPKKEKVKTLENDFKLVRYNLLINMYSLFITYIRVARRPV
jgi:dynein heavy chain